MIPLGFLKAHYCSSIQNGLEEAIWGEKTSEGPVKMMAAWTRAETGRWRERQSVETYLVTRKVRLWGWTGGEG